MSTIFNIIIKIIFWFFVVCHLNYFVIICYLKILVKKINMFKIVAISKGG